MPKRQCKFNEYSENGSILKRSAVTIEQRAKFEIVFLVLLMVDVKI